MILYVTSDYRNATEHFKNGQVIEVSPDKAEFLLRDSPGSFSLDKPEPDKEEKALDEPVKDKAVKSAPRRKAAKK